MVELRRQQHHAVTDTDPVRALRNRREEDFGSRRMGELLEKMMLDFPHRMKAVAIGGLDLLDRLPIGVELSVGSPRLEHLHLVKQIDLHDWAPDAAEDENPWEHK